jgi:hypothetical protein
MSTARSTETQLNLAADENSPAWLVDMEAFFDFSFWLAEELEDLVDTIRHRHGCSPLAREFDKVQK